MATTEISRSSARGMFTRPKLAGPVKQVDRRRLRVTGYCDDARTQLKHVWAISCSCRNCLVVMVSMWLLLLAETGDLDKPVVNASAVAQLETTSLTTIDRYLPQARQTMQLRGISTTASSFPVAQLDRSVKGQ